MKIASPCVTGVAKPKKKTGAEIIHWTSGLFAVSRWH